MPELKKITPKIKGTTASHWEMAIPKKAAPSLKKAKPEKISNATPKRVNIDPKTFCKLIEEI